MLRFLFEAGVGMAMTSGTIIDLAHVRELQEQRRQSALLDAEDWRGVKLGILLACLAAWAVYGSVFWLLIG